MCDPRYTTNLRTLYGILVTYADTHTRDTGRGKPYLRELAAQLGVSGSTLRRILWEGQAAGLFTVIPQRDPDDPTNNDANIYELHDGDLWNGRWADPLQRGQKATDAVPAWKTARDSSAATAPPSTDGGRTPSGTGPLLPPPMEGIVYTPVHNPSSEPALPDARRASTGRGSRENPSGAAALQAPRKKPPVQKQKRLTPAESAAVRAVESGLPAQLAHLLPNPRPKAIRSAILAALATHTPSERTADQITARIERRWYAWRYAAKADAGELESAIGTLITLLGAGDCPEPRCEDGHEIDTGTPCGICANRKADRKTAARPRAATIPVPRHGETSSPHPRPAIPYEGLTERWSCADCSEKFRSPPPTDGLCHPCRDDRSRTDQNDIAHGTGCTCEECTAARAAIVAAGYGIPVGPDDGED